MSANIIDMVRLTQITTNATPAVLLDYADLPNDCSFAVNMTIAARNTSNGDTAVFWKTAAGKKVGSTVTVVGSVLDLLAAQKDLSLLISSCSITASSANFRLTVTGVAATSIEWMVAGSIIIN